MKSLEKTVLAGIIFIILTFFSTMALAGSSVTFEWDANTESDLAGYRLYQTTTSGQYTFGDGNQVETILAGIEMVTLPDVPDGTYYWVATAYDTQGLESGSSNEVSATLDTIAPNPPGNFLIAIIERVIAFFRGAFGGLKIG